MSGLLDRIVRRRRASASSRLGPQSLNGNAAVGVPYANGGPPAHVNGAAPAEAVVEDVAPRAPEPELAAPAAPETPPPETPAPEKPAPDREPPEPASTPPQPEPPQALPPFQQRGRIRRRARYLRRLREVQLRDLGGFLVELQRFGCERPDLVQAKLKDAVHTDAELRALERALGVEQPVRELREAGIGGACGNCGAVHGSSDRYCASCGSPLGARAGAAEPE